MAQFLIQGGRRISGTHRVPGNKNAALPMLAAALLTDQPVTLANLPLIDDVRTMLELIRRLGAEVRLDEAECTVRIHAKRITTTKLDHALCSKVRSSILFAGPLLARCRKATLFPPGGDVIGRRRLDTHFDGLRAMGAHIPRKQLSLAAKTGLVAADILLDEASVTATENLLIAAAGTDGETVIYNAACEPHVQDLCNMLAVMGARIDGIGTNRLVVRGTAKPVGGGFTVGPDSVDAGSFLVAALVTGGELTLEGVAPEDFRVLEKPFRRFGVHWTLKGTQLHLPANQKLKTEYDFGKAIPKIEDGPWPAFPSDLMSVLIVLATQTRGTALFFEKMFESRMYFVDHLIGMGARIVQCDPHRVVVTGPTKLNGTRVTSPDIRAGMALLVAALCAKGETTVLNAESIDRGYAAIDTELCRLGARIKRIN